MIVWSCWRNAKLKNAETNCNSCNGRNKEKVTTMQKMERWGRRGLKYIGGGGGNRQAMVTDHHEWRKIVLEG